MKKANLSHPLMTFSMAKTVAKFINGMQNHEDLGIFLGDSVTKTTEWANDWRRVRLNFSRCSVDMYMTPRGTPRYRQGWAVLASPEQIQNLGQDYLHKLQKVLELYIKDGA